MEQHGFRRNRCTLDLALTLQEALEVCRQTGENRECHVVYLDIKAAFDSVPRQILWKRCKEKGIPKCIIDHLQTMFDHQSSVINIAGKDSQQIIHEAGVQQGSILSPLLYAVFIDHLAETLKQSEHKVKLSDGTSFNSLFYADDIALIAESQEKLQQLLNISSDHSTTNLYRFNVKKCATTSTQNLYLYGDKIPTVDSFKYLGVDFNSNGINTEKHISRLLEKGNNALNLLSRAGLAWYGGNAEQRVNLYLTFVRPCLEYGLPVIQLDRNQIHRLQLVQNKALRTIFGLHASSSVSLLHTLAKIPTMNSRYNLLKYQFQQRCMFLRDSQPLLIHRIIQNSHNRTDSYLHKLFEENPVKELAQQLFGNKIEEGLDAKETKQLYVAFIDREKQKLVEDLESKYEGHLRLSHETSKVASFLVWSSPLEVKRENISLHRLRTKIQHRILQWIAKGLPASRNKPCGNCNELNCSPTHITDCAT